jgi:Zn-dependent metalloprotease
MHHLHGRGCACCRFLPPYMVRELRASGDAALIEVAAETGEAGAAARAKRHSPPDKIAGLPLAGRSGKYRQIYDMEGRDWPWPPEESMIKRTEYMPRTGIEAVDNAFDNAGIVYDFYSEVMGRNSIDGHGSKLKACVNFGSNVANAFWDGEYLIYGSGYGDYFHCFTRSLLIAAHEMSHGVLKFSSDLGYYGQAGALNESFCDAMAVSVVQRHLNQDVTTADWMIGREIFGTRLEDALGVRSFTNQPAYEGHIELGTDPQPKHFADYVHTDDDNGGVHVNSGIPNHAFYHVAQKLGGNVWKAAAPIWYRAFTTLGEKADFEDAARKTIAVALKDYGSQASEAVADAWRAVGIH